MRKFSIIIDGNLANVSDSTGSFYCRLSQLSDVLFLLVKEDTPCVSVCSNGAQDGKYIFNPNAPAYCWDEDGHIKSLSEI